MLNSPVRTKSGRSYGYVCITSDLVATVLGQMYNIAHRMHQSVEVILVRFASTHSPGGTLYPQRVVIYPISACHTTSKDPCSARPTCTYYTSLSQFESCLNPSQLGTAVLAISDDCHSIVNTGRAHIELICGRSTRALECPLAANLTGLSIASLNSALSSNDNHRTLRE